ncbi:hypothetical protein QFC22_000815 [Naganishia vaughanmartiniae]|uniref:Uncharacterized protein n=1 Tax=Naganishia vaughanmartiniae TaxID=1424756 RepID=A0ACC2XMU5_9TREE|nr:hypothetical protein QFC22_000815 [Naganishia vaughanmartiniae]
MSPTPSADDATITKTKLQHDLAMLDSNADLLDAFLPPSLQHGLANTLPPNSNPKSSVTLDNYSPHSSTRADSLALSYAFVNVTRNGALKLVADAADGHGDDAGVLGRLGEKIEHVRSDAELLQKSLEGL